MIRDQLSSNRTVDEKLSALADDDLTRRVVTAHPSLFPHVTTEHSLPDRTIFVVFVFWLSVATAVAYGLVVAQLAHPL
jgi:hypothetical protein